MPISILLKNTRLPPGFARGCTGGRDPQPESHSDPMPLSGARDISSIHPPTSAVAYCSASNNRTAHHHACPDEAFEAVAASTAFLRCDAAEGKPCRLTGQDIGVPSHRCTV